MSVQQTQAAITQYIEVLGQRGAYGRFFAKDVTFTVMGAGQTVKGQAEVEQFIHWFHEAAFDAHPVVKRTIFDDGHAAVEFEFAAKHIAEFMGVPASGRQVQVPYVAVYDVEGDTITALRVYNLLEQLMQQIGTPVEAKQAA